jgi:YHS domain-containing protein
MKSKYPLFVAAILVGLATTSLRAEEKPKHDQSAAVTKAKKAKPYPLEFCLVSDEKFEGSGMTPFEMVQDGQTIKFCCKSCVKDFNKDPKKYLTKFADEVKKKEAGTTKKK